MQLIPDSDDINPQLTKSFLKEGKNEIDPYDAEDCSTDIDIDDYKDIQIEMHRFAKRQKSIYNWNNIK